MPGVPWEQRRDKLSGALWVIPVLFMAGAIAVGGLLSLINIGPDSAIAPLLFRGHADEAQKVLLAVADGHVCHCRSSGLSACPSPISDFATRTSVVCNATTGAGVGLLSEPLAR